MVLYDPDFERESAAAEALDRLAGGNAVVGRDEGEGERNM